MIVYVNAAELIDGKQTYRVRINPAFTSHAVEQKDGTLIITQITGDGMHIVTREDSVAFLKAWEGLFSDA